MSNNSSSNKRIARNTTFLYVRMILVLFVSLFTTRIVLNSLGVIDYGIYNIVAGFVSMFSFLNTSMANGIQRFYNFALGKKDQFTVSDVCNTAIIIQLLLSLVIFLLLETFGIWYIYNHMVIPPERFDVAYKVFQYSVVSLIFVICQIPFSSAILAYEKMDFYAYVSIFDVVSKVLVAYLLVVIDCDRLHLYGICHLIISIITFILYYSYSRIHFKSLKMNLSLKKKLFGSMLTFSGWNILGTFAYMINGQGLNLLLNSFFGPILNAAQGVANMITGALRGFQSNIVVAFRPQIIQSYAADDFERVKYLFFTLSKISFVMLGILVTPVIIEIDYILHLWLGNVIPDYTKSFTVLILVNMLISSLITPFSQIIHATGRIKLYQIVSSVLILAVIPFSWMALKDDMSPNVIYSISIFFSLLNILACIFLVKKIFYYKVSAYCSQVLIPCLILMILLPIVPSCVKYLMDASFIRLILNVLITIVMSFILVYNLMISKNEKQLLSNLLFSKIKKVKFLNNFF